MNIKVFLIVILFCCSAACLSSVSTEDASTNSTKQSAESSSTPDNIAKISANENIGGSQNAFDIVNFDDEKSLKSALSGIWKRSDGEVASGCAESIEINFSKPTDFCVEGNQIYISAQYKLGVKTKKVYLFLIEPSDLGRGGAGLSWENYDRRRPLATIDFSKLKENSIYLKWNGFYEKKAKRTDDYGNGYEGFYQKKQDQDDLFKEPFNLANKN